MQQQVFGVWFVFCSIFRLPPFFTSQAMPFWGVFLLITYEKSQGFRSNIVLSVCVCVCVCERERGGGGGEGGRDQTLPSFWTEWLELCVGCSRCHTTLKRYFSAQLGAYSFCAVFLFRFINRNRNKRVQKEQFSSERNNFHGNKMAHSLISNRKGKKYEKIIRERSSKNTGGYFDKRNERKRRCFCVKKNKKLPTHFFVVVSPSDFRRVVGFPLR